MKKLFLILFILFVCNSLYAIDGKIFIEYIQDDNNFDQVTYEVVNYASGIQLTQTFWKFSPYVEITTFSKEFKNNQFKPSSVSWDTGVNIDLYKNNEYKLIGTIYHTCNHGIENLNRSNGKTMAYRLTYEF